MQRALRRRPLTMTFGAGAYFLRGIVRSGYEPAVARNGQEALDAVREHHPKLLIVDAKMPVFDGYEVVQTIREELAEGAPCVIMLTASDRAVDRERSTAVGVDEFMAKPFQPHRPARPRARHRLETFE